VAVIQLSDIANEKLAREVAEHWGFVSGCALAEELPPVPWVCQDLALAPGPVTIVGGAGFGGKTVSMQALLLAVASGRPLWGQFHVRQGVVKHLDYEQGRPLTQRRYQRLARAMGLDLRDLEGILHLSSMPTTRLDDPQGERELGYILTGVTVAIIDAFRGAFPKAIENDSGVREYLDMLSKVSLRTGCMIIVIAHSKKVQQGDDGDVRSSLRGSGALFDAAQGVWMLDGAKGKPTRVNHTKERIEGDLKETFGLVIADEVGPQCGERKWGLTVNYLSGAELQAAYTRDDESIDTTIAMGVGRLTTLGNRILELLGRSPDGLQAQTMRGVLGLNASDVNAAMPLLISSGAVWQDGRGPTAVYRVMREPGEDG
jgi:hypothetical protein